MNKMLNGEPLKTKWGTVKINNNGYYVVTSRKEGNHGKSWHRLIGEEYFGEWINDSDDFFDIHHIDGDRTNNCVLNLEPMPREEHTRIHKKNMSNETRQKISEARKGTKHSNETRKKFSEARVGENNPRYKNYPRLVKGGFNNGKQRYYIMWKESRKPLKISFYIDRLVKWFEANYPDEELRIEV